jgi:serine/threonine-protein kinase
MATVYVGRQRGKHGFSRLVAVKRAHAHLVDDPELRRALLAEAKLASRLHHPNIVAVLDLDEPRDELLLVMDYVEGASLAQLVAAAQKRGLDLPPDAVVRIVLDACAGLHAVHELRGEDGTPLDIVHRDVSPQNILVGVDGLSRIADFGVAKWTEATAVTHTGMKGKFAYMAPEYIRTRKADRRADVFAIGVLTWEALSGRRLFRGEGEMESMQLVLDYQPERLSAVRPSIAPLLDAPIERALSKDPAERYASVAEFARDLETAARAAGIEPSGQAVTAMVRELYGDVLDARRVLLRDVLRASGEPSSNARALIDAEHAEGPVTATALGPVTLSDARTVPRPLQPVTVATPVERLPRGARDRRVAWALAVLVAAGAAVVVLMTNWSSYGPEPTLQPPATAALAATTERALPESSSVIVEDAPLGSAVSASPPHGPVPQRRTPVRPPAGPSAERAKKPGRPELGY